MLKKFGVVTTITTALVFGGALTSVDASASTTNGSNPSTQIQHQTNGGSWGHYVNTFFHHFYPTFNGSQSNQQGDHHQQSSSGSHHQTGNDQSQGNQNDATENEDHSSSQNGSSNNQDANNHDQQSNQTVDGISQYEQEVIDLTNDERKKQGLSPLKADKQLSQVAHKKSKDMSSNNYFSHNSPNYGSPFDMMKSDGINYQTAGENIAHGQKSPKEVVNGWMNSKGHRENILNKDFTHIGVGYVDNGNYWTQEFTG